MLKLFQDSALYIQRQLGLTESKLQDYVENASYRIDGQDTMVMGLPPPEVDRWVSARNYGLTHSIREIFIKILPNRGHAKTPYDTEDNKSLDVQTRVNHLAILTKALLPSSGERTIVSQRLDDMLGDEDEDEDEEHEELTLPAIRMKAISSNTHNFTWHNNFVPAYKFHVGDLGYIANNGDFSSFVLLTNVLEDGLTVLDTVKSAHGTQWSMGTAFHKQELQSFPAPCGFTGWPIVTLPEARDSVHIIYEDGFASIGSAWRFMLEHGKRLADSHGVKPENLMLVAHSGVDARFSIVDTRHQRAPMMHAQYSQLHPNYSQLHPQYPQFQNRGFHSPFGAQPFGAQPQPAIAYLFTSPEQDQEAVISESPVYVPLPPGVAHPRALFKHWV
ncbi:hypothetical protein EIP86_006299 [Pleurotus ostreatoroseus]|nr:hypothetical protein EIP86_006299 [Pleurotus ostreatoroseus]